MLKAAVAGTGLIATVKHLPAWNRIPDLATLVAIADVDAERGAQVAQQFNVPRAYTDLGELLEREKPDVVDICTPPRTHAPLAIQAMRGGAHVLVEKPFAVTVEECDEILEVANETGRSVCVGHSDLFYPSYMRIRRAVQGGAIGEFRGMRIFLSTPVDYITSKPDHWANALPGGVIGETGPHVVYMTVPFINPIIDVQVQASKLLPAYSWSPYEDYRVDLIGENAVSSVTLTYATNQWAAEVDVWGERGRMSADLESQNVVRENRTALSAAAVGLGAVSEAAQLLAGTVTTGARYAARRLPTTHDLLIREFCESIVAGRPAPVPGQEGRETIRVMNMIVDRLGA